MDDKLPFHSLEEGILLLKKEMESSSSFSISKILHILSGKGRPLLLILLSLPFCQPLQIPGMSTPFGLLIAFLGWRMSFGKSIWLPEWILSKTIPTNILENITDKTLILVRKIKPWIHPRINLMCRSPLMEKMNGILIVISGLFLALPLPIPLSNLAAAWAIFFIALGVLEDDGILVLLGYFIFFLTVGLFMVVTTHLKNIFSFLAG